LSSITYNKMGKRNLILVLTAFISTASLGQKIAVDSTYPPPGRIVRVDGRKMHLFCTGSGNPTVVLVAGGGAVSIDWYLVQSRIDSTTRVCSYDRAGLGWSDPGPAEETVEETVSDLHKLLQTAGEKPPYILVGASIGGIFIQAFQHSYPNEVVGLIFTNSSNHIGFAAKNKDDLIWNLTEGEIKATYPLPPDDKRPLPSKVVEPYDRLPLEMQPIRLWLAIKLQKRWNQSVPDPESMLSWRKEFLREFNESDTKKNRFPLGKLPVIVVSSNPKANDSLRYSRDGASDRLDYLSSNSIHITASESGHEIQLYQPDVLVSAFKDIIMAIRNNISLSVAQDERKK
jgi:pimeloyl-ACP methyl ester carboxylesterase